MATSPVPSASLTTTIAVMHARYEAAWAEDHRLEAAESGLDDASQSDRTRKYQCEDARKTIYQETNALRLAILYQVPTSWADALVVQFHVWGLADIMLSTGDRPHEDDQALHVAIATLFDFMGCQLTDIDHEAIGPMFKDGTMLAWDRGRARAADLEG